MSNYSDKLINFLEKLFIIFALLYYSLDVTFRLEKTSDLQIFFVNLKVIGKGFSYIIFATILYLVFIHRQQVFYTLKKNKSFLIFLLFVLASIFWSYAPLKTFPELLKLFDITLFSIYFTARYSLKEQLEMLAWTFGIAVSLSLIAIFVFPNYGVMGMGNKMTPEDIKHKGSWEGIYGHKNILGSMSLLSGLIFYFFSKISTKYFYLGWLALVASVCLIVGSTSRSALVNSLILLIVLPCYRAFKMNFRRALYFWITFTVLGGVSIVFCLFNAETILNFMGRDLTLSNRTVLWQAGLSYLWQEPWFGYGYKGFWEYVRSTSDYPQIIEYINSHSHNGFLELAMDLGLIGLSIFLFTYLQKCFQAIVFIQKNNTRESYWYLSYLTLLFFINLIETRLLGLNIFYLLWVTTVFGCNSDLKDNQVLCNSVDGETPQK